MRTEAEAEAQKQLHEAALQLESLCVRLLEIHESLPASPEEDLMLVGEKTLDVSLHVRTTVECVLHDRLRPAIEDLRKAAEYQPG
jgi:hypothetical protein